MAKNTLTLTQKFDAWHAKNPDFYEIFKDITFQAINFQTANGIKPKFGAWLVVNQIRWERNIVTTGSIYKAPNDFIALFSRKFMDEYPQHKGLFKIKKMTRA